MANYPFEKFKFIIMPTFQLTYSVRRKKSDLVKTIKLMALDETHARQRFIKYAKLTLKKFATIILIQETK
jgi:hypothetical protein